LTDLLGNYQRYQIWLRRINWLSQIRDIIDSLSPNQFLEMRYSYDRWDEVRTVFLTEPKSHWHLVFEGAYAYREARYIRVSVAAELIREDLEMEREEIRLTFPEFFTEKTNWKECGF